MKAGIFAGAISLSLLAGSAATARAAGTCNLPVTVGGGTLIPSPSPGAGWDVGTGQCNGDFMVVRDAGFPGAIGGDGIELGMRIEQRRVGPVNPPQHAGSNYEVQTGPDPTQINRAWWNFQQSIAYDGDIGTLDALVFSIRTDAGTSVPASPVVDMLALRGTIDARNLPKATATYSDLYQTSQNPVFGWFSAYDMNQPGAWTLSLAALKGGRVVGASICAHTPGQACLPAPKVYTCSGFEPPMNETVSVRKKNRVLPLRMTCSGPGGTPLTNANIAAPVVQVTKVGGGQVTDDGVEFVSSGVGTDGNEFVYDGFAWHFNLSTKNFTGLGTYKITAVGNGGDLLLGSPVATFVVE